MTGEGTEFRLDEKSLGDVIPGRFHVKTSVKGRVRTEVVDGVALALPEVGKRFVFIGVPLTFALDAGFRVVSTSIVVEVEPIDGGLFAFHTKSGSIYLFEVADKLTADASAILEVIQTNKISFITYVSGILQIFGVVYKKDGGRMH